MLCSHPFRTVKGIKCLDKTTPNVNVVFERNPVVELPRSSEVEGGSPIRRIAFRRTALRHHGAKTQQQSDPDARGGCDPCRSSLLSALDRAWQGVPIGPRSIAKQQGLRTPPVVVAGPTRQQPATRTPSSVGRFHFINRVFDLRFPRSDRIPSDLFFRTPGHQAR
jgi:hypothetical protein